MVELCLDFAQLSRFALRWCRRRSRRSVERSLPCVDSTDPHGGAGPISEVSASQKQLPEGLENGTVFMMVCGLPLGVSVDVQLQASPPIPDHIV